MAVHPSRGRISRGAGRLYFDSEPPSCLLTRLVFGLVAFCFGIYDRRNDKPKSAALENPSDTPEGVKSRNCATRTQRPPLFYLRARNYLTERYGTRYGTPARIQIHRLHAPITPYHIGRVLSVMGVAWQLKNGVSRILQQQVRAGAAGPATRCGTSSATARTGPTS